MYLHAGEISIVGPALSSLDADLAFQEPQNVSATKDARRNAAHFAAAQEARNMLGEVLLYFASHDVLKGRCICR